MGDTSGVGLGLSTLTDMFGALYGSWQALQGHKKLEDLQQPKYNVDPNILYNQKLAGQTASQGIPDSAKNFASQGYERSLGSSLGALLQTGQGLNSITGAQQNLNDSYTNLMSLDAQQKLANQSVLMNANKDVADENKIAFNWNQAIPYQKQYTQYSDMVNNGINNVFSSAKGAAGSLATGGFGGGDSLNKAMSGQFGSNSTASPNSGWYNSQMSGGNGLNFGQPNNSGIDFSNPQMQNLILQLLQQNGLFPNNQ